jgi:hypothetical protein
MPAYSTGIGDKSGDGREDGPLPSLVSYESSDSRFLATPNLFKLRASQGNGYPGKWIFRGVRKAILVLQGQGSEGRRVPM